MERKTKDLRTCLVLVFVRTNFENTKNIKNVLSENSYLFFKFSGFFFVFLFLCF